MFGQYRMLSKAIKKLVVWAPRNLERKRAVPKLGKMTTWPSQERVSLFWLLPGFQA